MFYDEEYEDEVRNIDPEDTATDRLVDEMIAEHIRTAFKEYGIEGTEDKIKEIYARSEVMKNRYISVYNRLVKGVK